MCRWIAGLVWASFVASIASPFIGSGFLLFSQDLTLDDFARANHIAIHRMPMDLFSSPSVEGDQFRYYPPNERADSQVSRSHVRSFGVMVPKCTNGRVCGQGSFAAVRDGGLSFDLAEVVRDRIHQTRKLAALSGPQIYRLLLIEQPHLSPTLGISIEHIHGERLNVRFELSVGDIRTHFLQLFYEIAARKEALVPLDFRYANLMWDPERKMLRPFDVRLMTRNELSKISLLFPEQFSWRMLQLAHTLVDVERALEGLTHETKLKQRCRSIVSRLRENFSTVESHEPGVRKQVQKALGGAQ